MLAVIAYGIAVLLNVGIIFIGTRFLISPRVAAAGYGVPAAESGDPAYLSIKGVRDAAPGLLGLALIAFTDNLSVAWFMLVLALIPLGDMLIVLRHGGTRAAAFGIHFTTAVVMLIDAALLFAL
ncbi:DUF4267 domain-containing protein [Kineosporia rhizophila]|uniref:DUF4267 domain-containing protein n=1 Tax=Kineosporia rhizophila TaxID=84633 RepID=UPI000A88A605|nr:DUF4267 domain-containing protein [Kineosporia rhizophila]MCE0536210.1 DUF4267 domain-containing protein [Kineosporia rhizophila]